MSNEVLNLEELKKFNEKEREDILKEIKNLRQNNLHSQIEIEDLGKLSTAHNKIDENTKDIEKFLNKKTLFKKTLLAISLIFSSVFFIIMAPFYIIKKTVEFLRGSSIIDKCFTPLDKPYTFTEEKITKIKVKFINFLKNILLFIKNIFSFILSKVRYYKLQIKNKILDLGKKTFSLITYIKNKTVRTCRLIKIILKKNFRSIIRKGGTNLNKFENRINNFHILIEKKTSETYTKLSTFAKMKEEYISSKITLSVRTVFNKMKEYIKKIDNKLIKYKVYKYLTRNKIVSLFKNIVIKVIINQTIKTYKNAMKVKDFIKEALKLSSYVFYKGTILGIKKSYNFFKDTSYKTVIGLYHALKYIVEKIIQFIALIIITPLLFIAGILASIGGAIFISSKEAKEWIIKTYRDEFIIEDIIKKNNIFFEEFSNEKIEAIEKRIDHKYKEIVNAMMKIEEVFKQIDDVMDNEKFADKEDAFLWNTVDKETNLAYRTYKSQIEQNKTSKKLINELRNKKQHLKEKINNELMPKLIRG